MFTDPVTFIPKSDRTAMTPAEKLALYEATASKYQNMLRLIRKYFMANGDRAGGWYEWETFITENYGTGLTLEFFDCPCVADNAASEIVIAQELKAAAQEGAEVEVEAAE